MRRFVAKDASTEKVLNIQVTRADPLIAARMISAASQDERWGRSFGTLRGQ